MSTRVRPCITPGLATTRIRLEGQVLSFNQAKHVGVMPGSRVILKKAVPLLHKELLRGLVLFEGAVPASLLNPALHHLVR